MCVILMRQSNKAEKQTQLDMADNQTRGKQTNRHKDGKHTRQTNTQES